MNKFNIFLLKINNYIPLLLILLLLVFEYCSYVVTYFNPILKNELRLNIFNITIENKIKTVSFFTVISSAFGMFVFCLLRTILTDPGDISKEWSDIKMNKLIKLYLKSKENNKGNGLFSNILTADLLKSVGIKDPEFKNMLIQKNIKFCKYCNIIKPERAHHCRQCDRCILKMDHHCNWVVNCIGFYNYKFFMLMLLYLEITLFFFCFSYIELFMFGFINPDIYGFKLLHICVTFIISFVFFILISLLLGLHVFQLSVNNKTTIEFCESKNNTNNYNLGVYKNLKLVLGNNILLWLLPINSGLKYNGLKFDKITDDSDTSLKRISN